MTRNECKIQAIKEFEELLTDAGWDTAYGKTEREIALSIKPLFTRTLVTTALSAKPAYLVYHLTDDLTESADNKPVTGLIFIDYNVITLDPFYFDTASRCDLLNNIEKLGLQRGWRIFINRDSVIPTTEQAQRAQYQTHYTAVKRFNNF